MASLYDQQIQGMLTDPNAFKGTPGFQFALNTGLEGVNRRMAGNRGSGNALAALVNYGTGLAQQDYGNQLDRLTRLTGQQQNYDLGVEGNRLTGIRDQNNFTLGQEQNRNTAQNNQWNYNLGREQNQNTAWNNRANFGLGMYEAGNRFALGQQSNANQGMANWWNNQNQQQRNQIDANNNWQRNAMDWWGRF